MVVEATESTEPGAKMFKKQIYADDDENIIINTPAKQIKSDRIPSKQPSILDHFKKSRK